MLTPDDRATSMRMASDVTPEYDPLYTKCPICDSDSIALYHRDFRNNQIFRCDACGVQFMNPVYSDAHLSRYYGQYARGNIDDRWKRQENTNRIKFRLIERFVATKGKVLDFGCGNANFMRAALARGWRVAGYDVDCGTVHKVGQLLQADVRCGDLDSIDWPVESFDLLHAHHVLEHLKDPIKALHRLSQWLVPGGYFYLAAPNIDSLASRMKFRAEKIGLRHRHVGKYYDSDHHVFYYSPDTMRGLLSRCGFNTLLVMNGNKLHIGDSALAQFVSHTMMNFLYSSSTFLTIAQKIPAAGRTSSV